MALWKIKSSEISPPVFSAVVPEEVLAEFEEPLTFTFRDESGSMMLAHLCAIGVGVSRYVACNTNENVVEDLKNGMVTILAALTQSSIWIVDVSSAGKVERVWATTVDDFPSDVLPDADVLLTSDLEESQRQDGALARFARSGDLGQISFDDGPVEDHDIEVGFYGSILQIAKELLADISEAIDGPVPILRAGMSFKSSYGVGLKVAERPSVSSVEFPSFFDKSVALPTNENVKKLRHAFEMLTSLIVDKIPSDDALTLVKTKYPLRQKYGKVLELIASNRATVAIRTRRKPDSRMVSGVEASERLSVVKKLGYPYMNLEVRGMLIGGQTHKSGKQPPYALVRVNDEGNSQDFEGTASDSVIEKMKHLPWDTEILARFLITEDDKNQKYQLVEIELVTEPSRHYVK